MVVIRLARGGSKKRPFYHVVATDKRNARDGRYIERLGSFNPVASGQQVRFSFDSERLEHWIAEGAQLSDKVDQLLREHKKRGVLTGTEVKAEKASVREKVLSIRAKAKAEADAAAAAEAAAAESGAAEA